MRTVRLQAVAMHDASQRYEDVYYMPPAAWLPVLSLGYRDAWASVLWCKSLVYFGEELGQKGHVRHLFNYMDAIVTLDPDFESAYRWAGTASLYRATDPTEEEGLQGLRYLQRAVERWPENGELRWELGSFMRFELAPLVKAPELKAQLTEQATDHLRVAALKGAGPAWLALNSASLLSKLGKKEQAIRHLEEIYATVNDDATKKSIEYRIASLRSETYLEAFKAAQEKLARDHAANFPYLDADLFFLVGPKSKRTPSRPSDESWVLEDTPANMP